MKQPGKQKVFSACTLKELCPEDKQKVAKLVKQVVELGQENKRLKQAADEASAAAEDKVKQIQQCNREAVKENCSLKNKLGQAVTVLRMYHHKVQGLDATIRALRNAADGSDSTTSTQQEQHIQERQDASTQVDNLKPVNLTAEACNISSSQQQVNAQQPRQVDCCTVAGEQSQQSPSTSPASSAVTAAALLQQQAEQLSRIIAEHKLGSDFVSPSATALTPRVEPTSNGCTASASSCGSTAVTQPQLLNQQRYGPEAALPTPAKALAGQDEKLLPITPLVLPSYCSVAARETLRDLAQWQLQQGLVAPEQAVDTTQKVLQFDPAIGSHGAFLIKDVSQVTVSASDSMKSLVGINGSSNNGMQQHGYGGLQQPLLPAADQSSPLLRLPAPSACEASTRSCVMAAAAVDGAGNSTRQSGTPGLSGLCSASPWDDPSSRQLLNLADAFNSLAVRSPGSAASQEILAPAGGSYGSTAAETSLSSACRTLPLNGSSTACAVCGVAPVDPVAVVGFSSVSVEAGPAVEESVQEVPVECVDAWQVPVMVQNEKSYSSLGESRSQLTSPVQYHQQQNGVHVILPPPSVVAQGHHQHLQLNQHHVGQQQPPVTGVPAAEHTMRHWPLQQQHSHTSASEQQRQCAYTVQQQLVDMQYLPEGSQQQAQTATVITVEKPEAHGLNQSHMQQHSHTSQPEGLWMHYTQQEGKEVLQAAAQSQQQERYAGTDVSANDQHVGNTLPVDLQHHRHIADYAGLADNPDTQELLERFDESLVDLLTEVERLEQQHQVCKQQMQQEMRHPKHKLPRQQGYQHWLAGPDTQHASCVSMEGAEGQYQRTQLAQQPRPQQHQQRQRLHHINQQQSVRDRRMPVHCWQQQLDEDDVVSDILNHLD